MRILTEAALDQEFEVKAKLKSGSDYGCMCVVFDGDVIFDEPIALEDHYFYRLTGGVKDDVGTILFTGNVTCTAHASISDRLMCLIVLGDFRALASLCSRPRCWSAGRSTSASSRIEVGGSPSSRRCKHAC